jgi:hypothetical protein
MSKAYYRMSRALFWIVFNILWLCLNLSWTVSSTPLFVGFACLHSFATGVWVTSIIKDKLE